MRSDADRISDILGAIAKVRERITDNFEAFQGDEMLQVWVIHYLQLIGEAARGVSQSLSSRHPQVPWPKIIALRNILVHQYFGIDLRQIWTTAQRELPEIERQIQKIQASTGTS